MFKRVSESVFMVGGQELSDGSDCLVYLVDLGEPVLIDCGVGPSWNRIRENIASAGVDPESIHTLILTHCHVDHIGAAERVVAETGCAVVAHELDAVAIESGDPERTASSWYGVDLPGTTVTDRMGGSEKTLTFTKGELRLLHTPGHTPGSLVVLFRDGDELVLFGQDIHGPFSDGFGSDIDAWRHSMEQLIELEADVLCEGHFGVYRPASAVRRFIEEHLSRHG